MKCPVCKHYKMSQAELEPGLKAMTCVECNGHWISSKDYWEWLDKHGGVLPEKPTADNDLEIKDTQEAKLCPDCGRILRKFKIGHDIRFKLDHCGGCNGVWFDKNEWEILKTRNLHDQVHEFFTISWQREILQEKSREMLDKIYTKKFGAGDYEKIKDIKAWIESHPQRRVILGFLNEKNPFKP
jgi:Zn-finger nucleic acid-binding protein